MKKILCELMQDKSKPFPILSYPGCETVGTTVRALSFDSALQARVMKAVADRCDSCAAVTPMDLSVEAECFGAQVTIGEQTVPAVTGILLDCAEKAQALSVPSVSVKRAGVYIDTVKKAKELIKDRPVIAGAAAPFSLAARLFGVTESMFVCYDEPEAMTAVLEKATDFIVRYVQELKKAGADGVILAEPVSGLLSPALEEEFSAPYVRRVVEQTSTEDFLLIYHNCGPNVIRMTESIYANGCDAYHFGNAVDIVTMLQKAPSDKPVMGNLDPVGLFKDGTPEQMTQAVRSLLSQCAQYDQFLLSSGCDVPPGARWDNIDAFYHAAKSFYKG